RRVVELRESQTAGGQAVEIRRPDLAAVTAQVGVSKVIGEDHHDIGPPRRPRSGSRGKSPGRDGRQGEDQGAGWHHRGPLRPLTLNGIRRVRRGDSIEPDPTKGRSAPRAPGGWSYERSRCVRLAD